jgi:hypothetical protein
MPKYQTLVARLLPYLISLFPLERLVLKVFKESKVFKAQLQL